LHPPVRQLIATVGQQPQRDQFFVVAELAQPWRAQRHHRNRVRVGGIGFAGIAGVEDPHPRGQLGRHVQHRLTLGEQPLRQRTADTLRALDRPPVVRPLLAHMLDQQPVARRVGAEAAPRQHRAVLVDRLDRHALLVWVHTHHHSAHLQTSSSSRRSARTGRATSSRAIPS
jgi:hypothetical protein